MSLPAQPTHRHPFLYRSAVLPVLALLRMGASPRKLAWSIALGLVVGVNPLLGSTTLVCLGLALLFGLNLPASQLANHLMYPAEVALLYPFVRLGAIIFHTGPLPLVPKALFLEARTHPWALIKAMWLWEWHAVVVWALIATLLMPVLAMILTPILERMMVREEPATAALVPTI